MPTVCQSTSVVALVGQHDFASQMQSGDHFLHLRSFGPWAAADLTCAERLRFSSDDRQLEGELVSRHGALAAILNASLAQFGLVGAVDPLVVDGAGS